MHEFVIAYSLLSMFLAPCLLSMRGPRDDQDL